MSGITFDMWCRLSLIEKARIIYKIIRMQLTSKLILFCYSSYLQLLNDYGFLSDYFDKSLTVFTYGCRIPFKQDLNPYLYLSLGAGVAADWTNHLAAVHPQLVVVDVKDAFMPGSYVYVVEAFVTHILEIHDVIPGNMERKREKWQISVGMSRIKLKSGR